ncbi:unnamed protein product [Eruca vesicaria subsp. sativa]|uniref:peptidylprolyl isomerase n=1 Tax=Eruca vesicaria subsp. sativa TaxID=29727 RepID=A0ABC8M8U6_ERUVS|nr:unnamed protein product [Eruca vesicaria subsp. sativa]
MQLINLSGDGGVLKEIVRRAKPDAISISPSVDLSAFTMTMRVRTLAEDGHVFDTTREDNLVFSFELGSGIVIRSWDIALKTMKVISWKKITCKPEYAYGIPTFHLSIATLIFEVELVACRPRKGSSEEVGRDLKKQRDIAAAARKDDKKKREEAKAAAAARIQAKLNAKKGQRKEKGKGKTK